MTELNKKARLLRRVILTGLLVNLLWFSGLFSSSARAAIEPERVENSDRMAAIEECLPQQLTESNKDIVARLRQVAGEWFNDQFERGVGLTENPERSQAEIEFENCLRSKGYTPRRQLS